MSSYLVGAVTLAILCPLIRADSRRCLRAATPTVPVLLERPAHVTERPMTLGLSFFR
jgi:hypothetical protein